MTFGTDHVHKLLGALDMFDLHLSALAVAGGMDYVPSNLSGHSHLVEIVDSALCVGIYCVYLII